MNATEFWQWFCQHSDLLMQIDDIPESEGDKLILELDDQLKKFSPGIDFEIGDLTPNGRSFLLTAEGDPEFFEQVIELYEQAPELDWWNFVAFRQGTGKQASVIFEGVRYDSRNMSFIPLENVENPEQFGITVGIKGYKPQNENQLFGVFSLIESMLGEYECGTLLGFLDLCELADIQSHTNVEPLENLPAYVEHFAPLNEDE